MIICANRIHKSTKGMVGDHWLIIFLKTDHFSFIMFNILISLGKHHVKNAFHQRHRQKSQHGILLAHFCYPVFFFCCCCLFVFNVLTKNFFPTLFIFKIPTLFVCTYCETYWLQSRILLLFWLFLLFYSSWSHRVHS